MSNEENVNQQNNENSVPTSLFDYQLFVRSTKVYSEEYALVYPALGLASEAGEVAGKLKKLMRDMEGQLTQEMFDGIIKELGDVLWYVTAIADDLGVTISDVFHINMQKLESRKQRMVLKGDGDER